MNKKLLLLIGVMMTNHFSFSQEIYENEVNTVELVEDYIYSGELTRKKSKIAFDNIKSLADEGNAEAICLLGVLYKDGIGTNLNFNKARNLFEESHKLGNNKASYSLGYLYLKGLGNANQDYSKAAEWFEKSTYPMAKHWLAKMNYFGWGLPTNRDKAIEMLSNNLIGNSQVLLGKLQYEMTNLDKEILFSNLSELVKSSDGKLIDEDSDSNIFSEIIGKWSGEWQFSDWSNNELARVIPIDMEVLDNGTGIFDISITLENKTFNGQILQVNNELIFTDMTVVLSNDYTDYVDEFQLQYRLTSFLFNVLNIDGGHFIKGKLESTILNWSEPAPPSELIIKREDDQLNTDILLALSEQKEHFIKVYPNPFKDDLLLYYSLENDSEISVKLYDYYNPSVPIKTKDRIQKKGERTITLDGLEILQKGLYIVNMSVGNDNYTRIVIKE